MHVYSIPACMPYAWGVAFVCIFIYRILDGDMPRVQHPYVVAPKNKRVSRSTCTCVQITIQISSGICQIWNTCMYVSRYETATS